MRYTNFTMMLQLMKLYKVQRLVDLIYKVLTILITYIGIPELRHLWLAETQFILAQMQEQ